MRISLGGATALAALGLLLAGAKAMAQQAPMSLESAPTSRETDINLSLDSVYDSNIARTDRQEAAVRGLSLADEIFTPSAVFDLVRPVGPGVLFLIGSAGYVFHRTDTILNRETVDVTGGLNGHVGRCRTLLSAEYQRQQTDLADQSLPIVSNTTGTTNLNATADCGRAVGFSPRVSVTQSWHDNSAPQYDLINQSTTTATGSMGYRQPTMGYLSVFGTYSHTDFPDRPLSATMTGQTFGYDYYGGGITYDRHLGGRIEGVASISYTVLTPNAPILPGFQGLTFAVDLVFHVNSRLTINGSAARATSPSARVDATYSINETYDLDATYDISPRLGAGIDVSRKTLDYPTAPNVIVQDLTRQTVDSAFATMSYKLTRRITIVLRGGDEERRGNFPGLNYSSTRAEITTRLRF